ncbi:MAG TPA: cobalamin-binding protein [Candidatus Binatus sp.]|jgi:iron complex transport system substrate-binding protein|nr:cobalamin-binding protein [Candidatus Binatus sp.]
MRICSLLPSATEILYALGLGDSVVGVTHECDFPAEASKKPALIRPRVDPHAAAGEINRQVSELVARGESIYAVDAELLRSLEPDLIITQDLCHVCAASPDDLATALTRLRKNPRVLTLTPRSLVDVWNDIRKAGDATQRRREAQALAITLEQRVAAIEARAAQAKARPRVLCLEWLDPFYVGGHWVPEMVGKAGGEDVLGRAGESSFPVSDEQIAASGAEIIVVMPCGFNLKRTVSEYGTADFPDGYMNLPAVREQRVFAVDANSYFSRPGPRLAEGVALLAHLIHPDLFPTAPPGSSVQQF